MRNFQHNSREKKTFFPSLGPTKRQGGPPFFFGCEKVLRRRYKIRKVFFHRAKAEYAPWGLAPNSLIHDPRALTFLSQIT